MKIGVISGLIVQAHSVCVLPGSPHRITSAGNRTATTTADAHRASRRSLAKGLRLRTLRPMDSSGTSLVRARRGDPRRGASRRGASRPVLLPRSARLSMLIWLVLVLAPLATVGTSALLHAVLYLSPALVFLVPLCLNRDPAGRLLVRLARPRRKPRGTGRRDASGLLGSIRYAAVWLARGGLLIAMARAGRAPPATPLPAVLALRC
jgi:hypothetical protein